MFQLFCISLYFCLPQLLENGYHHEMLSSSFVEALDFKKNTAFFLLLNNYGYFVLRAKWSRKNLIHSRSIFIFAVITTSTNFVSIDCLLHYIPCVSSIQRCFGSAILFCGSFCYCRLFLERVSKPPPVVEILRTLLPSAMI